MTTETNTVIVGYLRASALNRVKPCVELFTESHKKPAYEHVIILPMKDESIHTVLNMVALDESLLIIININQTVADNDCKDFAGNTAVMEYCLGLGRLAGTKDGMAYIADVGAEGKTGILVIDSFTQKRRLSEFQGVGMARKACFDAAVMLIEAGFVANRWIRSTDADALLTKAHFAPDVLPQDSTAAGACFAFEYIQDRASDEVFAATLMHHRAGQYTLRGWGFAGYPYTFHVLGSAMAVSYEHYCRVGGCEDVRASEDSNLMFRLAAIGEILEPNTPPIKLKTRTSNRCFGTGSMADKLASEGCITPEAINVINPTSFVVLGHLLQNETREELLKPEQWHRCKEILGRFESPRDLPPMTTIKLFQYLQGQGFELASLAEGEACLADVGA